MPRFAKQLMCAGMLMCALVVGTAAVASAHAEFEPDNAAPGSIVDLVLSVENERSDAGTVEVLLRFPESVAIAVAALPAAPGWTAEVEGGEVGDRPAAGVVWTRPAGSPSDDPHLPVRLGPLPATPGPLVFRVVQTYANGEQDAWVQEPSAADPDPPLPAPVLELVVGGPGQIPPPTTAPSTTTTTIAPTTTTLPSPTTTLPAAGNEADDDDDSSTALWATVGILGGLAVVGGALWFERSRRRSRRAP